MTEDQLVLQQRLRKAWGRMQVATPDRRSTRLRTVRAIAAQMDRIDVLAVVGKAGMQVLDHGQSAATDGQPRTVRVCVTPGENRDAR